jgi:ParB family chromosome partitioning protein
MAAKLKLDLSGLRNQTTLRGVDAESKRDQVLMLHPDEIETPKQVRKVFKDIEGLRASIDTSGQRQPVVVGPKNANGKYPLLVGGRRYRAAKIEPVILLKAIIEVDSGSVPKASAILAQIAENEQRSPLLPHELGRAIRDAQEEAKAEGGKLTGREIALSLGKREEYISQHLAIADIPESLEALIVSGASKDVTALSGMRTLFETDPALYEVVLAEAMEKKELSRYAVREALRRAKGAPDAPPATAPVKTPLPANTPAPQVANATPIVANSSEEQAAKAADETGSTPGAGVQAGQKTPAGGLSDENAANAETGEKFAHAQTFKEENQPQLNGHEPQVTPKSAVKQIVPAAPDDLIIFVRVVFESDARNGKLMTDRVHKEASKLWVSVVDGDGNATIEAVEAEDVQIVSISKRA